MQQFNARMGWMALSVLDIYRTGWRFHLYPVEDERIAFVLQTESRRKNIGNPLKESFRNKTNFKMVLLALFGAVMGQGVIWYTGQFYAQSFLENICKIEFEQSRTIMLWAIAFATPFFLFFGWLSDKIGRKWIMMAGMFLGIVTYRPIFSIHFLNDTNTEQWKTGLVTMSNKPIISRSAIKATNDSLITTTIIHSISTKWKFY